jgi:uncharacterized protein (DUF2147 family)
VTQITECGDSGNYNQCPLKFLNRIRRLWCRNFKWAAPGSSLNTCVQSEETLMKKLAIIAALLMTTAHAHAGNSISFEIDGHKVRIEAPKNCGELSCLKITGFDTKGFDIKGFNLKGLKGKRFDDDDDGEVKSDPPAPKPSTAPPGQATTLQPPASAAATATATPAPAPVAATSPQPAIRNEGAGATPAPATAKPAPVATAPVQPSASPIGVWATEDDKGRVRIEPCGPNLCGYAVKSGERILIDMKPAEAKWIGTIHDPDSGRDYDSAIAMKGANSLRVQGCAFGGFFCGGQIWNRVS